MCSWIYVCNDNTGQKHEMELEIRVQCLQSGLLIMVHHWNSFTEPRPHKFNRGAQETDKQGEGICGQGGWSVQWGSKHRNRSCRSPTAAGSWLLLLCLKLGLSAPAEQATGPVPVTAPPPHRIHPPCAQSHFPCCLGPPFASFPVALPASPPLPPASCYGHTGDHFRM